MPVLSFVERYPFPPAVIFAFFRRPANVLSIAPADVDVKLVDGPEELSQGSRFAVQVRRYGITRRIDTEVAQMEEPTHIVERQVQGPLPRWQVERRFVVTEEGTELTETIDFDPPGGMLGLVLTRATIEADLRRAFEGRPERVRKRMEAITAT